MRFFFDRCFPIRLMSALREIDGQIHVLEHHDQFFGETTTDVEWLRAVGAWNPKPVVFSGDTRILVRRDEVQELMTQDLHFITMYRGWTDQDIYLQTWKFFKAWPLMVKEVGKTRIASVWSIVPAADNFEKRGTTKGYKK